MVSRISNYQTEHAEDLVQFVLFTPTEAQWVNFHNFIPFKSNRHLLSLSHNVTVNI